MSKWFSRILIALGVLMIVGAGAYYWLLIENHMPSEGTYAIDMAEVRRLASSMPGDKPQEIRVEHIATIQFPGAVVVAGDSWDNVPLPVFSYQLVYADHTAIIDTAFDEATVAGNDVGFDKAAYGRMMSAMTASSLIVITHEHMDHIGGLATAPNLADLLKVTRLNKQQVENADRMDPVKWPPGALEGYQPIDYQQYLSVAPGVVLIRSPGHTPGSQLVYVQRADGTEVLFLGDVAWHYRNIELQRERARLATWFFLKEDRDQVMLELKEFKRLHETEPALRIVPGHDGDAEAALVKDGTLIEGFK